MRKFIISLIWVVVVSTTSISAHSKKIDGANVYTPVNENDSTQNNVVAIYRLFPTKNIWTFIKLNTRNGMMWQVQYDLEGANRGVAYLNLLPLVTKEKEVNGRFTLYSTENMYNFILLDQVGGKMWQAQWSIEAKNRGIIPIE